MFSFQEKAQIIEFPKRHVFQRFLVTDRKPGSCRHFCCGSWRAVRFSLSPPEASHFLPSPSWLSAEGKRHNGGKYAHVAQEQLGRGGGGNLKRNKQHQVHRQHILVLLPPHSHSISCLHTHQTHASPCLSLF